MRNWLRKLFITPEFPDEETTRLARQLNGILITAVLIFIGLDILLAILKDPKSAPSYWIFSSMAVVFAVLIAVLRRGYLRQSATVFLALGFLGMLFAAGFQKGVRDSSFAALTALILLTSFILGQRATIIMAVMSILAGFGLVYVQSLGFITSEMDSPFIVAIYMSVVFIANAVFALLATTNLNASLKRARLSEANLLESNTALISLRTSLEQQVEQRTAELAKSNEQSKQLAQKFKAVAEVARATTAHRNPTQLLPDIVNLISEHFGYYHVGIFLLDESGKSALLRAANSPGGKIMLAQKFKVDLQDINITSLAMSRGEAQIAPTAAFNYPDLPRTRSEAVLPLEVGERITGALDIQSEELNAFAEEDIEILTILADQVAIAIEDSQLFSDTTQALSEARTVYGQYLRQAWGQLPQDTNLAGFSFTGGEASPIEKPLNLPEINSVIKTGEAAKHTAQASTFAIPLKLRNQVIGVLDVRKDSASTQWSESQLTLVRAVAERVSLALENARLFEETTRRADRERTVTEITTRIRSTTDPETMLQTAIEELKQVLGANEIRIRPYTQSPANQSPDEANQKKKKTSKSGKN